MCYEVLNKISQIVCYYLTTILQCNGRASCQIYDLSNIGAVGFLVCNVWTRWRLSCECTSYPCSLRCDARNDQVSGNV